MLDNPSVEFNAISFHLLYFLFSVFLFGPGVIGKLGN
uniref:Uncharacterized protein n=1 Tax=Rhizophora mucronata TaxID=61149 RepID=A0A2P2PPQ9_RHIMU